MKNKKIKSIILLSFIFLFFLISPQKIFAGSEEIKKQIDELQENIKELEKQQKVYEENIQIKRKESLSLKNEINILDSRISKAKIEINKKEKEIQKTNLEIKEIQGQIKNKNIEIEDLKTKIAGFLRKINQEESKNYFNIILLNEKISEYFRSLKSEFDIQGALQETIDRVTDIKITLERQEKELKDKKTEIEELKKELASKKLDLEQGKKSKNYLLSQTQGAEWKFQNLLAQAKAEMKNAEKDVAQLEKTLRQKLVQEEMWKKLEEVGAVIFVWPVPNRGVTTTFHDSEYPFRRVLGEHPAIDIRASQGTQIRAPASGYIGRAKNGGMGYSYIMLIHQQDFSTVYGHVSKILVTEGNYVKRGDVIGLTGGLPGTPGAGSFSTGPHLHFEIRKGGLPVNPLNYLP